MVELFSFAKCAEYLCIVLYSAMLWLDCNFFLQHSILQNRKYKCAPDQSRLLQEICGKEMSDVA